MKFFPLLKSVARSFYLTICWFPSKFQKPVAVAYLLARLSDTIADEGKLSFSEREKTLVFLKLVIEGKAEVFFLWKKSEQWKKFSKKERRLIEQLPEMLQFLQSKECSAVEAGHIKQMWQVILEGQLMDLYYQHDQKNFSKDDLEKYLYLVAGSVGEFLTRLAHHAFSNFAVISLETMERLAVNYGKGLQLVNILRDFSHDQEQGRLYFSKDEKETYYVQAQTYLQQGEAYVNALHPGRFKMASALPLLLARKTLALIKKEPNADNIKIRRWQVYVTLLGALRYFFSGATGATASGRDHSKIPGEVSEFFV